MYKKADAAIKAMNRANLKAFGKLKLAKFDELKLIREVGEVYAASARMAKKKYHEIFEDSFFWMLVELGCEEVEAARISGEEVPKWVEQLLEDVDPVTLYRFYPEMERKADRLVEALMASTDKGREIERALRWWTMQVTQYADNCVYQGRLQAMRYAGVERVRWNTQHDERVCEECDERDGVVYEIDSVPPSHWRCRCWLSPAR